MDANRRSALIIEDRGRGIVKNEICWIQEDFNIKLCNKKKVFTQEQSFLSYKYICTSL